MGAYKVLYSIIRAPSLNCFSPISNFILIKVKVSEKCYKMAEVNGIYKHSRCEKKMFEQFVCNVQH